MIDEHKKILSDLHKGVSLSEEHKIKLRATKGAAASSILQIDINEIIIAEYESAAEAARRTGVERRNICSVCAQQRKTAGGYRWRYA